tara:strand:+ start:378 stop:545 length:168 start_codon:yes stop_codon:yes gene_type:complete
MIEEIMVIGIKQYYEIVDGTKVLINTEEVEISTKKNPLIDVASEYENIQMLSTEK